MASAGAGGTDLEGRLIGRRSAGFGRPDMAIYKSALRRDIDNRWAGGFGRSHCTQPIPGSDVSLDILAPGVIANYFTFRASMSSGDHVERIIAPKFDFSRTTSGVDTYHLTQPIESIMRHFEFVFGSACR
jgi:hypothetical protein